MSPRVLFASAVLSCSIFCGNSLLLQAKEPAGESRTWKDSTGAYSVEARLISLAGDQVRLERADGSQFTVPLERLSEADRSYVHQESLNRAVQGVVRIFTVDARTGASGIGGGIVVDDKGRVLTARHVVQNASRAIVQFPGDVQVQVLGCKIDDTGRDLALLELAPDGRPEQLNASTLGSDVDLPQGMPVYAVGHPQEFENTVSKGVVGAVRETSELPMSIRMRLAECARYGLDPD
jgi:S1-C subfamily serine protease